jgi:hypothetical protein
MRTAKLGNPMVGHRNSVIAVGKIDIQRLRLGFSSVGIRGVHMQVDFVPFFSKQIDLHTSPSLLFYSIQIYYNISKNILQANAGKNEKTFCSNILPSKISRGNVPHRWLGVVR